MVKLKCFLAVRENASNLAHEKYLDLLDMLIEKTCTTVATKPSTKH